MNLGERRESIKRVLTRFFEHDNRVAAVYLYGSIVHGPFGEESDLDVGVLFRDKQVPLPREIFDLQVKLSETLSMNVDLVALNQVSPILSMQVLRKGERIMNFDSRAVNNYFVRVVNDYDDLKRVRKPIEDNILNGRIYGR